MENYFTKPEVAFSDSNIVVNICMVMLIIP